MKAIITTKYGKPKSMCLSSIAQPKISASEILVKIHACSVNPVDWKIRSGKLKIKTGPKPPKILGSDFAGEIIEVGKKISQYKKDQKVWGKVDSFKGGAYAEFIKVKPQNITHMPTNLSFQQAASIPNTGLTAYQALINKANIKKDMKVLINGASGGVGIMALQIAKAQGCHVTAVCSGKNTELVKSLGADVVIDYTKESIFKRGYYHIFFDCVSNQSLFKARKIIIKGGTYIRTTPSLETTLGFIPLKLLLGKSSKHIMVQPNHHDLKQLKILVESKKLVPIIDQTLPLEQVHQAHQLSESGRVAGKIVMTMI